ncbi:unnamed protein product [Aphanomyces euteiches]|uniref:Ankyrin repeat-containing domain n=1 Tax=Aphanomyces euteiches TaxID=100861 RepID=A0A6G0WY65_9STRA|nr:hypothetical protein Ae201684_010452 [Aphanomyces euteiches]KAH9090028.1 hypothetical protein Ae201684P_014783 [Aphanomyces euteiches]KAH9138595.1 hypothetical protein AeRB84_017106 [Aphanomyces euteiches]
MDNAAGNGHLDVVRFLHDHRREGCNEDAMAKAAANGHLDMILFLMDHRLVCIDKAGSALSGAVKNGHVEVVKFFLGLPVKSEPRDWFDYIRESCHEGHVAIVQVLWVYGDAPRSHACLHLETAARRGHLDIVRFFIEQNRVEKVEQGLVAAATNGHLEIVKFLVEHNFIEQVQHAAQEAASNGHLYIVKYLVERGLDIDLEPAFIAAAKNGHLSVVKYCGCQGATKAMYEAAKHSHEHVVRFIMEQNALGSREELMDAARKGHSDCVQYLSDHRPLFHGTPVYAIPTDWLIRPQALCRYLDTLSTPSA